MSIFHKYVLVQFAILVCLIAFLYSSESVVIADIVTVREKFEVRARSTWLLGVLGAALLILISAMSVLKIMVH